MPAKLAVERMTVTQLGNRLINLADALRCPVTCHKDAVERKSYIEQVEEIGFELKVREGIQMPLWPLGDQLRS